MKLLDKMRTGMSPSIIGKEYLKNLNFLEVTFLQDWFKLLIFMESSALEYMNFQKKIV